MDYGWQRAVTIVKQAIEEDKNEHWEEALKASGRRGVHLMTTDY